MIEIILIISIVLYFISFIPYLIGIFKNEVKPRPLSWLGWFILVVVSVISQIQEKGFDSSMSIVIASGIICFTIFLISIIKNNPKNGGFDYICFSLGILCMIIYLLTKNALITTIFAVLSDLLVGIPTIRSAFRNPRSEDILAWGIGTFAIFLSFLVALTESDSLLKIYPTYLFVFNALIFILCIRRFNFVSKK